MKSESNNTKLTGLKRVQEKTINDLQVVTYARFKDGVYSNVTTTVRSGKTLKGTLLFESPDPVVSETFATLYPELMLREFKINMKDTEYKSAWFAKQYPDHMFGTEQYDEFRGKLVIFKQPLELEKKGFIKIF